jgi:hypothetical protein
MMLLMLCHSLFLSSFPELHRVVLLWQTCSTPSLLMITIGFVCMFIFWIYLPPMRENLVAILSEERWNLMSIWLAFPLWLRVLNISAHINLSLFCFWKCLFICPLVIGLFILLMFNLKKIFFLCYWGLNSGPILWATPTVIYFVSGFFEIGSCELFAQAGFKPPSSWSLPPE